MTYKYLINLSKEELDILIRVCEDFNHKLKLIQLKSKYIDYEEVQRLCKEIVNQIGYTQNTIFKEDISNIFNRLKPQIMACYGKGNTEESLAISIVTEVLDYYGASYDDIKLCNDFNVSLDVYSKNKIKINYILKSKYWQ